MSRRGLWPGPVGRIPDVSAPSLQSFITAHIKPGAVLLTDAWQGYAPIGRAGYTHKPVSVRASPKNASELMPRVHRVAALLKRWLLATHQGAVQPEQLDYYLDEFTFRFNRREARAQGLLFYRLLQQAVNTEPQPYAAIAGGARPAEVGSPADHKMYTLVDSRGYPQFKLLPAKGHELHWLQELASHGPDGFCQVYLP